MTALEQANSLRRLADAVEATDLRFGGKKPGLDDENALGAISILQYVRSLFTTAGKETFAREDILVVIDAIGHDPEIFPLGAWDLLDSDMEVEECAD